MPIRLFDLHNDVITNLPPKHFSKYISIAEKNGVKAIIISIWTTEMQNPMQKIKEYRQILESINTRINLLMHIEDAWFLDEQNINDFISYKPISVGLTWNENNNLAGGAHSDGFLTPLGKNIVNMLSDNDILIDLAHLNKQSFDQVAEILRMRGNKLICTHTCFDEVNQHPRNLDRQQIGTIVNSGGLIGLTLVGNFLCTQKQAHMNDVYLHIKYFIDNFCIESLAIGTDFFGTDKLPNNLSKYKNFKNFRKFLLNKGLSDTVIDQIFQGNAKKFFSSYND